MLYNRFILLFATISSLLSFSACTNNNDTAEKNTTSDMAIPVTISLPVGAANNNGVAASGQIEAATNANISTRVMGYITKLNVKVGDHVKQGQLLFTVNSTDISAKRAQTEAMIAQAEAAVKSAQKDFERFTTLYNQQSASAKELDNITLQYSAAKANLDAAKQMRNEVNAQFAYTNVTAPFSGTITQKLMDAGSMATPGMPILIIEQADQLQVSATIAESDITKIKTGDAAVVNIKSGDKKFNTRIIQLYPSSANTGGQYIIKLAIPKTEQTNVYSGMYVNVFIPAQATNSAIAAPSDLVLVPTSSIINKEQLTGIYTVSQNNTALLRWVRLGKTYGSNTEILSGLNKTESFIVNAQGKLYNGVPVSVTKQ
ncbi:efflux RND transporter periplasmic adaptor subunit [Limnovirga soli]|uniref:Efflux RND transporter periplasmic adaptor subunit n=1 Tax=Limnovirga soli TaxID=2656915 RepID=A0A8J8JUV7_9BACT|nr:efflux RND transporter periplasmic adaptor subunit [Limnovirga soli]NNV56705.1 efflux RND transporter periplasmic adaptor subunit [Limnovirga soli]